MKRIRKIKTTKASNELETLLINTGMSRPHSLIVSCLVNLKEVAVSKLIDYTGLLQPEISVATVELEKAGIINFKLNKLPAKGRPYKSYTMMLTLDQLASKLEKSIKEKIKSNNEAIKRLKENRKPN